MVTHKTIPGPETQQAGIVFFIFFGPSLPARGRKQKNGAELPLRFRPVVRIGRSAVHPRMVRQELRQAAVGQRVFEQPLDRGKRAGGHIGPRVEALDDVVRVAASLFTILFTAISLIGH